MAPLFKKDELTTVYIESPSSKGDACSGWARGDAAWSRADTTTERAEELNFRVFRVQSLELEVTEGGT